MIWPPADRQKIDIKGLGSYGRKRRPHANMVQRQLMRNGGSRRSKKNWSYLGHGDIASSLSEGAGAR
eukprot:2135639-Rhodomonas_salina.3